MESRVGSDIAWNRRTARSAVDRVRVAMPELYQLLLIRQRAASTARFADSSLEGGEGLFLALEHPALLLGEVFQFTQGCAGLVHGLWAISYELLAIAVRASRSRTR